MVHAERGVKMAEQIKVEVLKERLADPFLISDL